MLTGIVILDLTHALAGPYGSLLLADLGAEVVKIENPNGGDVTRNFKAVTIGDESAYFFSINRNKKSVVIDLKKPEGKEVFFELVKKADVVVDNFRPGITEKLGCDYESLKVHNPRIISCSISGYGYNGPDRDKPAFDLIVQALSGGMSITGAPGSEPARMGIPIGDLAGGMFAAVAITAALHKRNVTGLGERIDISLLDCQISLLTYVAQYYLASGKVPEQIGSAHETVVPYQAFRTADSYIVVACWTEKFWQLLCTALSIEELAQDYRFESMEKRLANRGELISILEDIFEQKTRAEWLSILVAKNIPSGTINNIAEALSSPQVRERDLVVEIDHPKCGTYQTIGSPFKYSKKPVFTPPPSIGEHTTEILKKFLGYSGELIDSLKKNRAIV